MADRERYDRYCKLSRQFLDGINRFVVEIVDSSAFLMGTMPASGVPDVEECFIRFCFLQGRPTAESDPATRWRHEDKGFFKQRELLVDHIVTRDAYHSIKAVVNATLDQTEAYAVDMLDLDVLRNSFNSPIPEIWAALAFAAHGERVFEVIPWFGSSLLIRKAT